MNEMIINNKYDQTQTYFRCISDVRPYTKRRAQAIKNSNDHDEKGLFNVCITKVADYFGLTKYTKAMHFEGDFIKCLNDSEDSFGIVITGDVRHNIEEIKYHSGRYPRDGIVKDSLWNVGNRQRARVYHKSVEAAYLRQTEETQLNFEPVGIYVSVPYHAIALDLKGKIVVDTAPVNHDSRYMEQTVLVMRRRGTSPN